MEARVSKAGRSKMHETLMGGAADQGGMKTKVLAAPWDGAPGSLQAAPSLVAGYAATRIR